MRTFFVEAVNYCREGGQVEVALILGLLCDLGEVEPDLDLSCKFESCASFTVKTITSI